MKISGVPPHIRRAHTLIGRQSSIHREEEVSVRVTHHREMNELTGSLLKDSSRKILAFFVHHIAQYILSQTPFSFVTS